MERLRTKIQRGFLEGEHLNRGDGMGLAIYREVAFEEEVLVFLREEINRVELATVSLYRVIEHIGIYPVAIFGNRADEGFV